MIEIVQFCLSVVLSLAGIEDADVRACKLTGGSPIRRNTCYQTLASCYDADGWGVTCPNSLHCDYGLAWCIR